MEKAVSYTTHCVVILLLACCAGASAQNKDIEWLRSINNTRTAAMDGPMAAITNSAYPVAALVPVGQLLYGYTRHDSTTIANGWQTVAGIGINTVIAFGLKYAVNRERPYTAYPDIDPYQYDTDPSFPSGHTSYVFAIATTLTLEYPKWYIIAPAYLWAASVGYSRLYLGMHYPSDVLGGAIVGAGSAWISYKCNRWLQHKRVKILHF